MTDPLMNDRFRMIEHSPGAETTTLSRRDIEDLLELMAEVRRSRAEDVVKPLCQADSMRPQFERMADGKVRMTVLALPEAQVALKGQAFVLWNEGGQVKAGIRGRAKP